MTSTCCATTSNAWPHASPAWAVPGCVHEDRAACMADRARTAALPARRPARWHRGRILVEVDAAVRAACLARNRGAVARCSAAAGVAGARADLRQVRTDPVDPS